MLARRFIDGKARPQPQTPRHLNYDATLQTYLAQHVYRLKKQREQKSKLTEGRGSYNQRGVAHAPTNS